MLEVADRIDADGIRYLPGSLGQLLDRRQRPRIERAPAARLDHEEEVVVLRVGILQILERLQLGICLREEHPVVRREFEPAGAGTDHGRKRYCADNHQPSPPDDAARQCCCETIDCLEVRAHFLSPVS
jgi:hypothetical protein